MAAQQDRTIPATPRRREQARRAGLGAPAELPAWAAIAATAILLLPVWVRLTVPAAGAAVRESLAAALGSGRVGEVSWGPLAAIVLPTAGLIAASAAAGLAVRFLCDGLSWRPGRAAIDLRRIDPLAGLGRIFSRSTLAGLVMAGGGLAAVVAAACLLAGPLARIQEIPAGPGEIGGVAAVAWQALVGLVATAAVVAVAQWLLARRRFERSIRMTPAELAEEQKELQADPRVRLLQRQGRGPRRDQPAAGTS
jgi:flagellar biosynthetic protein FlhB